jgi:hypothetical protein
MKKVLPVIVFVATFSLFFSKPSFARYFGVVDNYNNQDSVVTGWFCESGHQNEVPSIHIYATAYNTGGNCIGDYCFVKAAQANLASEQAIKNVCWGHNRRFNINVKDKLADGLVHKIKVYATYNDGSVYEMPWGESAENNEYYQLPGYRYKNTLFNSSDTRFSINDLAIQSPQLYMHHCPASQQLGQLKAPNMFFNNSYHTRDSSLNQDNAMPAWCNNWARLTSWSLKNYLGLASNFEVVTEYGYNSQANGQAAGVYRSGEDLIYGVNLHPYSALCSGGGCIKEEGYFILAPTSKSGSDTDRIFDIWSKDPNAVFEASIDLYHPVGQRGDPLRKDKGSGSDSYYDDIYGGVVLLFRDKTKPVEDNSSRIWVYLGVIHLDKQPTDIPHDTLHVDGASTQYLIVETLANERIPYLTFPSNAHGFNTRAFSGWKKYVYTITPQQFLKIMNDAEAQESTIKDGAGGRGVDFNFNKNLSDWVVSGMNYNLEMRAWGNGKTPSHNSSLGLVFKEMSFGYYSNTVNVGGGSPTPTPPVPTPTPTVAVPTPTPTPTSTNCKPTLAEPFSGVTINSRNVSFKWNKCNGTNPVKYQVNITGGETTTKNTTNASLTYAPLNRGTKTWKVRECYNTSCSANSNWSNTRQFYYGYGTQTPTPTPPAPTPTPCGTSSNPCKRGDYNKNGILDISDVIALIKVVFD